MNFGFWEGRGGGPVTANPSKILLSQFCNMSTFHMAQALLMEAMFYGNLFMVFSEDSYFTYSLKLFLKSHVLN
jgi:hypothetical protein